MAEQDTGATATEEQDFTYPIKVEDAGPATKRVSVEISQDRIQTKLTEQYQELRQQAAIPGFRPGHAPQKLIEKRFSGDVKEQVRRSLISESYEQAVEKNNLQVIGEPTFDSPDLIQLPESGPLTYSFEVEVQPDIQLPELKEITIKRPAITVNDEHVDQAMQNLREQQGTLVPVEDRGVEVGDQLIADVHVKIDGKIIGHQHDATIIARKGQIGGIDIEDLDEQLAGLKPGEKRDIKTHVSDENPNEVIKGKDVEIEVALKDLKKLELAEINQEFLESLGFENESELRDALREQMEERIKYDVQQAMREQVHKYLLDNINIELPTKLSVRQAERIVQRRAVDMLLRGIPEDQIQANVANLRAGATAEAGRDLKLFFILQKIANDQNVDVEEGELNGRIAMIAAQQGRRPEKVKQDMAKDGTLSNMYVQMREQKAVDQILSDAKVEDVEVAAEGKAKKGKKKSDEAEGKEGAGEAKQEDAGQSQE
ncbi:MAG: trigger factor [Gemmatimonadaceae bacterium]|nr:trigger factor [Gemmatimonadaceae bacterium]